MSLSGPHLQDFYNNSPMREGILNWYPFTEGTTVLDASKGALTSLLKLRCGRIVPYNSEISNDDKFDYIVVLEPGEITVKLLMEYKVHLNPHGRLLMAFDNPFGLQFFSGKPNCRSKVPFTFFIGESKAEAACRLMQAGFEEQKWYYPFTNLYFTREIYSENYLPNEFLNHRNIYYMEDDYTKEFDERNLWKEVIRNGAFEFLCNSYLVEARICKEDKACSVDYAAITAYRSEDKAFVTTLHNNGIAKKQALFPAGASRLTAMCVIHRELSELGIKILPVTMEKGMIIMKRLKFPTLWDYMGKQLINGKLNEEKITYFFDRLKEAIYQASKNGKCYWELVPANCFYDECKDEIIFFDQENCWENMDRDLVLVRALHALKYSYHFRNNQNVGVWLSALIARYSLEEKWDKLSEIIENKNREYLFNESQNTPIDQEVIHAKHLIAERNAERIETQLRYKKMSVLAKRLKEMAFIHPAIYGYGKNGKMLRHILESNGIVITCVIDQKMPTVKGLPVYPAIEKIQETVEADVIIVTPASNTQSIVDELRRKTTYRVFSIQELENEQDRQIT